jgi:hypothetical protein
MAYITIPEPGSEEEGAPCAEECKHNDCIANKKIAGSKCSVCGEPVGYNRKVTALNGHAHAVCAEVITEIDSQFQDLTIDALKETLDEFKKELKTKKSAVLQEKVDVLSAYIKVRRVLEERIQETVESHRRSNAIVVTHKRMLSSIKGELMNALITLGRQWEDGEGGYARRTNPTERQVLYKKATLEEALPALVIGIAQMKDAVALVIGENLDEDNDGDKEQIKQLKGALDQLEEAQTLLASARSTKPPRKPTVQVK